MGRRSRSLLTTVSLVDEWNGAVFRDSEGAIYWTEDHICGYENLTGIVLSRNLRELYDQVSGPIMKLLTGEGSPE
jgi:hypothetical protein